MTLTLPIQPIIDLSAYERYFYRAVFALSSGEIVHFPTGVIECFP
jgi:hypothetical protein